MSYINSIGIANPDQRTKQMDIYQYMVDSIPFNEKEKKVLRYLYKKSGIKHRHSVLSDFNLANNNGKFYNSNNEYNPSIEQRLAVYDNNAANLAIRAIKKCIVKNNVTASELTHLICVSCTGMSAPGVDTEIISKLELSSSIQRFNVNFMGCFAAVNGLKLADALCKAEANSKVLVVCVELCTLHFQNEISDDYNLSNMLFADGSAAVLVSNEALSNEALHIHGFYSDINSDGVKDMSWNISSSGFLMKLSSYVPQLLNRGFKDLIDKVLKVYNIAYSDLNHWAIHPGGRRILDNIEREFQLESNKLNASRSILENYGNMSSPTILYVLQHLQEQDNNPEGEYIFAAAFGPGLTTETALLSYA